MKFLDSLRFRIATLFRRSQMNVEISNTCGRKIRGLQSFRYLDGFLHLRIPAIPQVVSRKVSGSSGNNAVVFQHPSLLRQIASHG